MPESKLPFTDSHCHMLNLGFLVQELLAIAWNAAGGNYPKKPAGLAAAKNVAYVPAVVDFVQAAGEIIKWLIQTASSATGSYEDIYKTMKEVYRPLIGEDVSITPLMMDIYYMFYPMMNVQNSGNGRKLMAIPEVRLTLPGGAPLNGLTDFKSLKTEIKQGVLNYLTEREIALPEGFEALFDSHAQAASDFYGKKNFLNSIFEPFETTPGFISQLHEITGLSENYGMLVKPFLAVDPRRKDYMKMVRQYVGPGKPFPGVKLYPRLGYHPDVFRGKGGLFEFCDDAKIPVTVHTSKGGFPPDLPFYDTAAHDALGDPGSWGEIAHDYAGMRINLAHFGGDDIAHNYPNAPDKDSWTMQVLKLMTEAKNKNIYTDISCFTDPRKIEVFKTIYGGLNDPELKSRFLFGTDFDISLITRPVNLNTQLDQYFKLLGADIQTLARDNARKFMEG